MYSSSKIPSKPFWSIIATVSGRDLIANDRFIVSMIKTYLLTRD